MDEVYIIQPSSRKDKKLMVVMGPNMVHHFGQAGYDDYTTTNDVVKKKAYLARHSVNEDWTKKGIHSSGFWAKHVLWAKPTIRGSIKDLQRKFGIKIIYKIK
jgi:hypothetical protein